MKKILGLCFVVYTLLLSSQVFASKKGADIEQEICNAEFKLQYPQGINHVLFTVVLQDPMEYFKKELTADKEKLKKIKPDQKMGKTNISEKYNMIVNYWDYVLDTVTGSHIWELGNNDDQNRSSFKETTNCFKKAWLVTRMTWVGNEAVGWSIPVNLKKGKTVEITLTPNNAIKFNKLEKVYDSIVK